MDAEIARIGLRGFSQPVDGLLAISLGEIRRAQIEGRIRERRMSHQRSETADGAGRIAGYQIEPRKIIRHARIILRFLAEPLELLARRIALTDRKQADGKLIASVGRAGFESQRRAKFLNGFGEAVIL